MKRVLANRQSAQRSRIRKLQHISELEETLQGLQDDVHKLTPQLTKLEAKQAGSVSPLQGSADLLPLLASAVVKVLLGSGISRIFVLLLPYIAPFSHTCLCWGQSSLCNQAHACLADSLTTLGMYSSSMSCVVRSL